jgi:outer membrane protein assembly factor BamB
MLKYLIHSFVSPVLNLTPSVFRVRIKTLMISLLFIIFFFSSLSVKADEWKGWRGLKKQACSDKIKGPVEWTATSNVLWKVNIEGEGYSSPVVSERDVIVTAAHINRSKLRLNNILINLLLVFVIIFILRNLLSFFKDLRINKDLSKNNFIFNLFLFVIYGLLVFAFCIMYWMYFNENRAEDERILINYLFSGSVFLFCTLLIMIRFPKDSIFRIIYGLIVVILVILLVKYRPLSELYLKSELFNIKNIWIFQLIIPSVLLPLLMSFFLVFKTVILRIKSQKEFKQTLKNSLIKSFSCPTAIFSLFIAFFLGLSGFLAIPIIAFAKWFNRDQLIRIQAPLKLNIFFDPNFAYPFFLGVISIGFLVWFIIENKKNGYERKNHLNSFLVLIGCSALFFIILNYGVQKPEYRREIICIDRYSGIIKWRRECFVGPAVCCSNYNSQATPTPLIDSSSVYAYFGIAGFISTDKKGNIKWANTNLPFESNHGVGASPIFCRDGIIVLNAMSKNPYLISLDSKTGKQQWKTILPSFGGIGGEYRTPIIFELNGQELIIEWSTARNQLALYEAKTGKVLYQYDTNLTTKEESIVTPIINEGVLYLSNDMSVVALDMFKLIKGESPIIWESELKGKGPATSSPVLAYGMLFMVSDNGFVSCLDSKTGKILWQKKLKGIYFSSPISVGQRIYFSNRAGMTTVVECSPKFRQIAENYLPEGLYSTLVPVDGQLFIRTKNTLWCLK